MKMRVRKASCQLCSMSVLMLVCEGRALLLTDLGLLPHKTVRKQPWAQQSPQDSTGRDGEEQSWRLKMTWGKKQLHCWFVTWKLLPPGFPACWLPALDLVNWHIMRLSFVIDDKNLNSFVWVKDKPFIVPFVQHQLSPVPTGWGPGLSYMEEDN